MSVSYLAAAAIRPLPHGFFGRQGGASSGAFASNNMSVAVGDDADIVLGNRDRACRQLGLSGRGLVLLRQVHSSRVIGVAEPPEPGRLEEADGMVTSRAGLVLGILTADCAPVLLADHEAGVVGAVHAGWKGAVADIAAAAVEAMERLGAQPARICAAIGPTISAANYEVGPEFVAGLLARHPDASARVHRLQGGREHFDLPGFVADRLRAAGVGHVEDCGVCTYADEAAYFSHRRATHRRTATGRQIALIGLPP